MNCWHIFLKESASLQWNSSIQRERIIKSPAIGALRRYVIQKAIACKEGLVLSFFGQLYFLQNRSNFHACFHHQSITYSLGRLKSWEWKRQLYHFRLLRFFPQRWKAFELCHYKCSRGSLSMLIVHLPSSGWKKSKAGRNSKSLFSFLMLISCFKLPPNGLKTKSPFWLRKGLFYLVVPGLFHTSQLSLIRGLHSIS